MLPILARLREPRHAGARAIVLCPTRELAQQIFAVILRLTKGTSWNTLFVRKETSTSPIFSRLPIALTLLVATPFRLAELVAKGYPLANVEHVVLDEADRLFDMSDKVILSSRSTRFWPLALIAARRCWLFSATRVETAEQLARSVLHKPVRVVVGAQNRALETVSQRLIYAGDERGKLLGLWQLIRGGVSTPMLVFVQSQSRAIELARELRIGNVRAAAVHGGCSQQERDDIVSQFRVGEIFVIVATDVLARGIDYSAVKCVVNYDVPLTRTNYIHRVGRTGRAGRRGEAVTFCSKEDRDALRIIASIMKESGSEVPDWIFKLPNPTAQARKELAQATGAPRQDLQGSHNAEF
jgi:ATP-dependent RNA helicase DDX52/ROK1